MNKSLFMINYNAKLSSRSSAAYEAISNVCYQSDMAKKTKAHVSPMPFCAGEWHTVGQKSDFAKLSHFLQLQTK